MIFTGDQLVQLAMAGCTIILTPKGGVTVRPPGAGPVSATERSRAHRAAKAATNATVGAQATQTLDATDATDATTCNETALHTPSLPLSPLPPCIPLPPAPPPAPAIPSRATPGRARPTLEQAKQAASQFTITDTEAESWWLAREASEWTRSSNGSTTPVGTNWQADLRIYTNGARERAATEAARHSRSSNGYGKPPPAKRDPSQVLDLPK